MSRRLATTLSIAGVAVACASSQAAPPGEYQIAFASTDLAVAVESVEVLAFDAKGKEATFCNEILIKRRSGQDVGTPLARSQPRSPCEVLQGKASNLDLSFGVRGFLVIGKRASQDYVLGCTLANVGPGTQPPLIQLNYATPATPAAPPTTCRDLTQRCANGC